MARYTLSSFSKAISPFLGDDLSEADVLSELFQPLVKAYGLKNRFGDDFLLDYAATSRIMTGKEDVPRKIREALARPNCESVIAKWAARRFSKLGDDAKTKMVNVLYALWSEDELASGQAKDCFESAADNPIQFLSAALIAALNADNRTGYDRCVIWETPGGSLSVIEADLLSLAFNKKLAKSPKIVVIPVNTGFTMAVDDADAFRPRVSSTTLHGKFLCRAFGQGVLLEDVKKAVKRSIEEQGLGSIKPLPVGTIATFKYGKTVFYLLAISVFDENNNAHATEADIVEAADCLVSYYVKNGQGLPVYVPLIGTGLSRANLAKERSLEILEAAFTNAKSAIFGDAYIVAYNKQ